MTIETTPTTAMAQGADRDLVMTMHAAMWEAVKIVMAAHPDPRMSASLAMTASGMLAGSIYGQMIVAGIADDTHCMKKLAAETIARNFMNGIPAGVAMATRVAKDGGYVN
jgi:hypothetical protein